MRTVHITFSPDELGLINSKADTVGLTLTAYIRQMALGGKVKGYKLRPLLDHAQAVGEVAKAVRAMTATPHESRWAYEADIERIEHLLRQLIESEQSLISDMTRRIKR